MATNRRDFLRRAALAAGLLAADPEAALWRPAKKIFIPPTPGLAFHRDAFAISAIDLPLPPTYDMITTEILKSLTNGVVFHYYVDMRNGQLPTRTWYR